jgi:hypothetical protein
MLGLLVGVYEVVGRGGTQAVINMAGEYVGCEIQQFAQDQGEAVDNLDHFREFLIRHKLAGDIQFTDEETGIRVKVAQCRTYPKRVGHYAFDGSDCPWGDILIGLFSGILNQRFSYAARLTPVTECEILIQRRL